MESHTLAYKSSSIHYLTMGSGTVPLIALHGYGLSAQSFLILENQIPASFKLIAPDLPFHGRTHWQEPGSLEPEQMAEILLQLVRAIFSVKSSIRLLGYSMGGRIGLSMLDAMSDNIEKATLLAPQGFNDSFVYWLVTRTFIGKHLFRFTMHKPAWFIKFLSLTKNPGHRFFGSFLESIESRELLYQRWMAFKKFHPPLNKITTSVQKNKTIVNLVFGNSDEVIPYPAENKFLKDISLYGCVMTLPCGHHILTEKNLPDIIPLL